MILDRLCADNKWRLLLHTPNISHHKYNRRAVRTSCVKGLVYMKAHAVDYAGRGRAVYPTTEGKQIARLSTPAQVIP